MHNAEHTGRCYTSQHRVCVCVCRWVDVGGRDDSRLCSVHAPRWHRVREQDDGAVSSGVGWTANKITFYGPTTPEECLFVCMHDGGDRKLMHRH